MEEGDTLFANHDPEQARTGTEGRPAHYLSRVGRRLGWGRCAVLLVAMAATPGVASAAASGASATTPAQSNAVAQVGAIAGAMAPAQTPAVAEEQQIELMPSVQAVVNQGQAAVQQLLDTTSNPSVAVDLLHYATITYSGGPTPTLTNASRIRRTGQPLAHKASVSCYGPTHWSSVVGIGGVEAGYVEAGESAWCGDPTTRIITEAPTYNHGANAYYIFCLTGVNEPQGPVQPPHEDGAETAASIGGSYGFGCFGGLQNIWVEQNVWASGATDQSNDFGYTS